jgi:hypothetical protein
MEHSTCSLYDGHQADGNETFRLSPSWFNGDARDGEGSATPIDTSVTGEITFCIAETVGCANPLTFQTTVSWE